MLTVGSPISESTTTPEVEVSVTVEENYVHFNPVSFEESDSDYQVLIASNGTWLPRHGMSGDACDECYVYQYDSTTDTGESSHTAARIDEEGTQMMYVLLDYDGERYIVETVVLNAE